MADKSFGVKELNLLNASGTPTITSPNNLNLNANTVAISTSVTVGQNLTVSANAGISSLNVTGIATVANFNATGISTIVQPADGNPMANWTITNNSNSAYRFTGPGQSGSDDNPDLYLVRGHRYIFKHNATSSHPIQIRIASSGAAYTDGITYSDTGNNRTTDGNNLIINLQHDAPPQLFYQCTAHGGMVGNIYTVGGPQVISGILTATAIKLPNYTGSNSGALQLGESPSSNIVMGHQSGNGFIDNNQGELRFYSDTNILLSPDDNVNVTSPLIFTGGTAGVTLTQSSNTPRVEFKSNNVDNAAQIAVAESSGGGVLQFYTKASGGTTAEKARIDLSGRLLVGRTNNISVGGDPSDHCFEQITNNGYTLTIHANQTNQRGIGMFYTSGKTPEAFMLCQVSSSNRFIIAGNGNVTNANDSYGQISDQSLKENIVDAKSQWNDIKNLKIRNFNFKSSTGYDTHTQIGLVAQEVETVCPKLVDTNEDGIKSVTTSVLYMKAVKALQEAQARIETLEAKVAALEGS